MRGRTLLTALIVSILATLVILSCGRELGTNPDRAPVPGAMLSGGAGVNVLVVMVMPTAPGGEHPDWYLDSLTTVDDSTAVSLVTDLVSGSTPPTIEGLYNAMARGGETFGMDVYQGVVPVTGDNFDYNSGTGMFTYTFGPANCTCDGNAACPDYALFAWRDEVDAFDWTSAGVDYDSYDYVVIAIPYTDPRMPYIGIGGCAPTGPGKHVYILDAFNQTVMAHELGHKVLNGNHLWGKDCCGALAAYRDISGLMGSAGFPAYENCSPGGPCTGPGGLIPLHFAAAPNLVSQSWFSPSWIEAVDCADATYTLDAWESESPSNPLMLQYGYYYITFRSSYGDYSGADVFNDVLDNASLWYPAPWIPNHIDKIVIHQGVNLVAVLDTGEAKDLGDVVVTAGSITAGSPPTMDVSIDVQEPIGPLANLELEPDCVTGVAISPPPATPLKPKVKVTNTRTGPGSDTFDIAIDPPAGITATAPATIQVARGGGTAEFIVSITTATTEGTYNIGVALNNPADPCHGAEETLSYTALSSCATVTASVPAGISCASAIVSKTLTVHNYASDGCATFNVTFNPPTGLGVTVDDTRLHIEHGQTANTTIHLDPAPGYSGDFTVPITVRNPSCSSQQVATNATLTAYDYSVASSPMSHTGPCGPGILAKKKYYITITNDTQGSGSDNFTVTPSNPSGIQLLLSNSTPSVARNGGTTQIIGTILLETGGSGTWNIPIAVSCNGTQCANVTVSYSCQ